MVAAEDRYPTSEEIGQYRPGETIFNARFADVAAARIVSGDASSLTSG